jgi:predicted aspartyl protease
MKQLLTFSLALLIPTSQSLATGFKFKFDVFESTTSNIILTSVQFDDKTVDCMIDTGARFTLIKESLLSKNTKVGEIIGGGASGKQRTTELIQADVKVGDWSNRSGIIGRIKDEYMPTNCLLGNDFFLDKEFSIDFDKKAFEDETSFSGKTFPLKKYISNMGGHFGFEIEIAGSRIPTLFDTGATDTAIDIKFVEDHPEMFEFVKEIDVREGSNQTIKAGVYKMKSVKMGPIVQTDVKVYVLNLSHIQSKIPGVQAVIGLSQMTKNKWYINNKTSVWGVY